MYHPYAGDPAFRYGPLFPGFVSRAATSSAIHSTSRSSLVTPAAIAGVTRSVLWIRQKRHAATGLELVSERGRRALYRGDVLPLGIRTRFRGILGSSVASARGSSWDSPAPLADFSGPCLQHGPLVRTSGIHVFS